MNGSTSARHGSEDSELTSLKEAFMKMFKDVPSASLRSSIYRVPERVRSVKREAYAPMIVSIGPFHNRTKVKALELMDEYKLSNLVELDQRHPRMLEDLLKVMMESEVEARNCYDETISLGREELFKVMLLDGCFIVELFRQKEKQRGSYHQIFSNHWISNAVYRDLFLLENQLPFFLLERLFTVINDFDQRHMKSQRSFLELSRSFLVSYPTIRDYIPHVPKTGEHLVDLLLNNICNPLNVAVVSPMGTEPAFIPSATELHETGIILRKSSDQKHILVITFKNGVLSIPPLHVDGRTESLFRNLLAMEQSHCGKTASNVTIFSDYLTLLDCLINTPADVALLQDREIIHNGLGDTKEVAQLFNNLRNGVDRSSNGFFYGELFQNVNVHYRTRWLTWNAKLKEDYLGTPWKILSICAGMVLIICTIIQTYCAVVQVT